MSYILDALKRADAERERGAVPGLHARPLPSQGSTPSAGTPKRLGWLMAGAVLALVTVGTSLWVWRAPTHEASVTTPMPVAAAPLPVPGPAPAPAPAPVPVPVPTTAVPAVPAPSPVATSSTIPSAVAPTPPAPRPVPSPSPTANTKTSAKPSAPAPATTPSSALQETPLAPAVLPLLSELPEAIRRQVPPLTITGTVYSDNPAQRLLLINNQVLPQGSQVAPEVTLEEIRQRNSVFNFRGTRFRVAY